MVLLYVALLQELQCICLSPHHHSISRLKHAVSVLQVETQLAAQLEADTTLATLVWPCFSVYGLAIQQIEKLGGGASRSQGQLLSLRSRRPCLYLGMRCVNA